MTSPWSLRAEEATFKLCVVGPEIVILSDTECLVGYWFTMKEKIQARKDHLPDKILELINRAVEQKG